MWHFMGVMLSAAGSLQWLHDRLAPEMSFDELISEAEAAPAGCEGLQFLPYLSGERTPHPDPLARAAWVGLTLRHGRGHMTRAVLEGVAFGLKDCFDLIKGAGLGEIQQVRISGGGAKSALWREILASAFESKLVTVNTTEGAAYGAALLAGVSAQAWGSVPEACKAVVKITGETRPKPAWVEPYRRAYTVYRGLYPALKPTFEGM
jgi:xylulokinase